MNQREGFTFAGFEFPRAMPLLQGIGPAALRKRLALRQACGPSVCGPYFTRPAPIVRGAHPGASFYLESDFMPGLRWQWCDEILPRIGHRGWYSDEFGDAEKIRGIVMRLPHARGFLAGWSMGEGMASEVDGEIHETAEDAARAADSIAENVAEKNREYEAAERARLESEEGGEPCE